MIDVIRTCISELEERLDYWIKEGDLTAAEIGFILQQLDNTYEEIDDEEEEDEDWEEAED